MTINPNDPKLTAYALGELDEKERAEIEAQLAQSKELRHAVDEIRDTADLLTAELVGEPSISLSADQRAAIETQAAKPSVQAVRNRARRAGWVTPVCAGASIAAVLGIAFTVGDMRYGNFGRRGRPHAYALRSVREHIAPDAASSRVREANDSVDPFMSPSSALGPKWESSAWNMAYNLSTAPPATERKTRRARSSPVSHADADAWGTPVHPTQSAEVLVSLGYVGAYEGAPQDRSNADLPDGSVVYDDDGNYALDEDEGAETMSSGRAIRTMSIGATPDGELDNLISLLSNDQERSPSASKRRPPPVTSTNAKIIKTGELALEVDGYAQAVERMRGIVKEHTAVVADASTNEQTGGALSGRLAIRVSPDRFEPLFNALKSVGQVEAESVKTADVTANYVDLESRIASLEITQARLAELVTNKSFVDKMSALLEVEREMTRVRSQLEQLIGQLRVMGDRVALSTITVSLHEPARIVPSASLSIEVPVLKEAAAKLGQALARVDGRLTFGRTSKQDAGTLRGDYRLRVRLSHFANLLSGLESLGRVEQRQVNDRQFGDSSAPWAQKVQCDLTLVLYERSRQLPSGSISIEVDELARALDQLDELLVRDVGSIVSNHSTRRGDGSSVAELKLQVPAGQFAAVAEAVTSLGRITGKSVSGEAGRIVGGAASVPCELSLHIGGTDSPSAQRANRARSG